jgi:hypothetical protein
MLSLLPLLIGPLLFAADIDLRPLLPEIRDQGPLGNCFAQTVADLATLHLKVKKKFVSPDAISVCSKEEVLNTAFNAANQRRGLSNNPDFLVKKKELRDLMQKIQTYRFQSDPMDVLEPINYSEPAYVELLEKELKLCKELYYPI